MQALSYFPIFEFRLQCYVLLNEQNKTKRGFFFFSKPFDVTQKAILAVCLFLNQNSTESANRRALEVWVLIKFYPF